jgi:predicted nucleotidyltransferase
MVVDLDTEIRRVLADYPQIQIATLFGSAARDALTDCSDMDIAVAAQSRLSLDLCIELGDRLTQALHREVDLIDLQAVSGTILAQSLSHGRLVLKKDAGLYAELIKRLWFNQADMMPYTRRILTERRKRFLYGSRRHQP